MRWNISALKFMYNMERFATQIYLTQRRSFSENETIKKLATAAENEQQHVDILAKRIQELDGSRSHLGLVFQMMGRILAVAAGLPGKLFVLKTDVLIEKRAINDYGSFLNRIDFDDETIAKIERIIADEKRHVGIWESLIKELKSDNITGK